MERYRLKNIIIIILLLLNVFLMGSLFTRETSERFSHSRAEEQLAALFAADGISLSSETIPEENPPATLSLIRSMDYDRSIAEFFLGKSLTRADQGGGIHNYSGEKGVALFRSNGGFDIAGSLSSENGETLCRDFCKTFSLDEPVFALNEEGSGTASAACLYNGLPVMDCTVTFTFDRGILMTVSGTALPASNVAVTAEDPPLSAVAALTAFQQNRRETGAVVSSVTEVYACYILQNSASSVSLAAAWCIVTDTSSYYVNCSTGSVTSI